jgi:hypothetical protein
MEDPAEYRIDPVQTAALSITTDALITQTPARHAGITSLPDHLVRGGCQPSFR